MRYNSEMTAASDPRERRPRWRARAGLLALLLAAHAAACCVAWWTAEWRVPLPDRAPGAEASGAWLQRFDHHFRIFFIVYCAAAIFFFWAAAVASRRWWPNWFVVYRAGKARQDCGESA